MVKKWNPKKRETFAIPRSMREPDEPTTKSETTFRTMFQKGYYVLKYTSKKNIYFIGGRDILDQLWKNNMNTQQNQHDRLKNPHFQQINQTSSSHSPFSNQQSLRIQVCPKILGLPLHSYSFRMGLEPQTSCSIGRGLDS